MEGVAGSDADIIAFTKRYVRPSVMQRVPTSNTRRVSNANLALTTQLRRAKDQINSRDRPRGDVTDRPGWSDVCLAFGSRCCDQTTESSAINSRWTRCTVCLLPTSKSSRLVQSRWRHGTVCVPSNDDMRRVWSRSDIVVLCVCVCLEEFVGDWSTGASDLHWPPGHKTVCAACYTRHCWFYTTLLIWNRALFREIPRAYQSILRFIFLCYLLTWTIIQFMSESYCSFGRASQFKIICNKMASVETMNNI